MVDAVLFSSKKRNWPTPVPLFQWCDKKYGKFQMDFAASKENTKCKFWLGPGSRCPDAFAVEDWSFGGRIKKGFLNPEYGRGITGKWVKYAYHQAMSGSGLVICMLLPSRTDQAWYHDYLWKPFKKDQCDLEPIKGRVWFEGAKNGAPFPSVIATYNV